jgi:hypothetical protein
MCAEREALRRRLRPDWTAVHQSSLAGMLRIAERESRFGFVQQAHIVGGRRIAQRSMPLDSRRSGTHCRPRVMHAEASLGFVHDDAAYLAGQISTHAHASRPAAAQPTPEQTA